MPMLSPAEFVIRTFGGVRRTARLVGRSAPSVSKWRAPKHKRGTGGMVPMGVMQTILKIARVRQIDIDASDLINGRFVYCRRRPKNSKKSSR